MKFDPTQPVKQIVAQAPGSARVFEMKGIDYCCGGEKPLGEACRQAGVTVEDVLLALQTAEMSPTGPADENPDWSRAPLASIIEHIVANHHQYCRREQNRIAMLLAKVADVHGARHPELFRIQSVFLKMSKDLTLHLTKEETTLFPLIQEMERAAMEKKAAPKPLFGTIQAPISMMILEHDGSGAELKELRGLSNGYALPGDACSTYHSLYEALQAFEQDMHRHVYLENYVLFPRTVELEKHLDAFAARA
ncbi:MAG: iron-sulfur cluster repair di-iron protein [Acidobacteriota bacterium]|nr:iron-sulfur cluster repair di-iron protein [Acidobacteriota bacterium]